MKRRNADPPDRPLTADERLWLVRMQRDSLLAVCERLAETSGMIRLTPAGNLPNWPALCRAEQQARAVMGMVRGGRE